MKKITTLYKKDPNDLGRVINEINPGNEWVFRGQGYATRKFDGTSCAIINKELYKRYDSKINKKTGKRKPPPLGAIPCQEPDEKTGHWPHWVKCERNNPEDKYHFEAFDDMGLVINGTFELCGPKIQGNPEGFERHILVKHGSVEIFDLSFDFHGLKYYLEQCDFEGIVFHHESNGRMCKLRKSDFGFTRIKK